MVLKRQLHANFQWFFEETITIECFLGGLTIAINGFTMFFLCCYHRFQWFSMVLDHWSNDAMVSMDRCGLTPIQTHSSYFVKLLPEFGKFYPSPKIFYTNGICDKFQV